MITSPHFPSARFLLYTTLSPFLLYKDGMENKRWAERGEANKDVALISHPLDFSGKITANNKNACQIWEAGIASPRSEIRTTVPKINDRNCKCTSNHWEQSQLYKCKLACTLTRKIRAGWLTHNIFPKTIIQTRWVGHQTLMLSVWKSGHWSSKN